MRQIPENFKVRLATLLATLTPGQRFTLYFAVNGYPEHVLEAIVQADQDQEDQEKGGE